MESASLQCTPSDLLGKAIDYSYKLWSRLRRYALDGSYQIDNNAVFYSLLESCQIVGVRPLEWLTYAFKNLHNDTTEDGIIRLLPHYYKESQA